VLNIKVPASGGPDTAVPPGVLYEIEGMVVVPLLSTRFPSRARMRTWLACSWNGCCHRPSPTVADQRQLARMHVRVAVVGLVRVLGRVVGVHQVGHGAPVGSEVSGMVRLGLYVQVHPGFVAVVAAHAATLPGPPTSAKACL